MARKLLKHQQAALDWSRGRRQVAFFMQMRLGKTLTAIRWAKQFNLLRILVVCPLPVVYTWQEELLLEGSSSVALIGSWNEKITLLAEAKNEVFWWITNYESLYQKIKLPGRMKNKHRTSPLHSYPWDCVILDESTYIRNPKPIRTKMTRGLRTASCKAILTGLPNPESSLDYFEQMAFLYGQFMGVNSYWKFRSKYYHPDRQGWHWTPNPKVLSAIKEEVNARAFVLTRKQVDMGSKKIYEKRFVFLPPRIKKLYTQAERDFELDGNTTKWILVVKNWIARLAGGYPIEPKHHSSHKVRELVSLFQGELKNEYVIVWFRFNNELFSVAKILKKAKMSYATITGEDEPLRRSQILGQFQKKKFKYLLMQIKCGKFGIDCSTASTAIYYSNTFSYEERTQSEDRIINPKKKEPVLILDIITKDTIDEDIYWTLKQKAVNAKSFVSKILAHMKERIQNAVSK